MSTRLMPVLLLSTICYCLAGCKDSKEEQVIEWLRKCPPVSDPGMWPPEAFTYSSHEEWADVGRKIEGIEETLIGFYANNTSGRPMWIIVVALGLVSDDSVPILIRALQDEGVPANAKHAAIGLLGRIRDPAAVGPLCEIVHSTEDKILKFSAISALGRIGDPNARPVVESVLRSQQHPRFEREALLQVLEELKEK